ncbi:MAG: hypothetical protein KatS3mg104_3140 [Phycisphaerae bacterium]|nr:MAG: hypothetical protein KatS3mg104_3140 [Phycisphaerae bacterium]
MTQKTPADNDGFEHQFRSESVTRKMLQTPVANARYGARVGITTGLPHGEEGPLCPKSLIPSARGLQNSEGSDSVRPVTMLNPTGHLALCPDAQENQ